MLKFSFYYLLGFPLTLDVPNSLHKALPGEHLNRGWGGRHCSGLLHS